MLRFNSGIGCLVALMVLVLWCSVQLVNSDETFEDDLKVMFQDKDLRETIKTYLDLVPSSHKSRSSASRIMSECGCKAAKKAEAAMGNKHLHKNSKSYKNSLPLILSISIKSIRKTHCECGECPPIQRDLCLPCPKIEPCSKCPPCPIPEYCSIPSRGKRCPAPPKCKMCISDLLGLNDKGKSNKTTTRVSNKDEPPSIIMKELALLMVRESEQKKLIQAINEAHAKNLSVAYNSSSLPALIAKAPLPIPIPPMDEIYAEATMKSTTTSTTTTTTKRPPYMIKTFPPQRKVKTTTKPTTTSTSTTTTSTSTSSTTKKASIKKVSKVPKGDDDEFTTTTTTTTTTYRRTETVTGIELFEKNINRIQNDTLREQILGLLDKIPENTGGKEMHYAKRLLMRFGENTTTTTTITRRGHHRSSTFMTARFNLKRILGYLMEQSHRHRCKCKACPVRKECHKCPDPPVCPPKKCDSCPTDGSCPVPDGCPKYPPCKRCEPLDKDAPDYDGPEEELDDVDDKDVVVKSELKTRKNCKKIGCLYEKTCGNATLNPLSPKTSGYINGGEDELYGEWPSFARMDIDMPDGSRGLCGGVLISNQHLLTAGHCVITPRDGDKDGIKIEPKAIIVHLADHMKNEKDEFEQIFKVKSICRSSKFNDPKGEGSRYDFAVLTLEKNVTFNDHIQPACLPWHPMKLEKKNQCFVVGLGVIKYSPNGLHEFAKTVQKMRIQRASCRSWGFRHNDRSRYCWTKHAGKGDSCGGDSGGPILCLCPKTKRWIIQGLVSYGSSACDGTEKSGWVGVYTRIPQLLETMSKDCEI